ncbi:peptidylprolyl isomerase [Nissabacter sp. SGAir0207]|uniref:peptidylprolyl isomerase n=1 Tax=Nissabacter sp. SGAir0207 TaxID=2126321 RepID=UPI0010CD6A05|nr:peptidylprolyl isomerase [Nissabacter sp. SGAir0207]QCR36895.1 peptidylprolyl isomerase [Nissabacter sp. SGAir0207]
MMDNLRAASNHVVLKVILALIILSFVLTGVGNYLIGGSGDYAAKVNGQEISRAQFEQAFQNERARMQQRLGEQFSLLAGNEQYMQGLRQQVLNQLVDVTLIDQYAKKLGVTITDEQVKESILATPAFRTNNQFDNDKYLAVIRSNGFTADNYAQVVRRQLQAQQLNQVFGGSEFVLPVETDALAALVLQSREVRVAAFDTDALAAKQTATDDELKAYYDQHRDAFIAPQQMKVSYLEMDAAALQDKVTVSDAEIAAYYDQHQNTFGQPERKKYGVIVLKTQADADAVLADLKKGADFAELAKTKSIDTFTGQRGGELDWMEPETTLEDFKNANLTEKGQLSGVIKSSSGFLILKLNDLEAAKIKPLAEVRADVLAKLKQEKALDAFYALQQKVSEAATNDNESLASAEEASGLKAVHTDWFTQQSIPQALNSKAVVDVLFDGSLQGDNGTPGSNSNVISADGDRAFVVRIDAHKPQAEKPLAEVHDEVLALVKRQKAQEQAQVEADKVLTALKAGKGDEALKANGLSFGETQNVQRSQQPSAFEQNVYSLPQPKAGKPSFGVTKDEKGNVALVALDKVTPGHLPPDAIPGFSSQVKEGATNITFDALLSSLRESAKIKLGSAAQAQ